MSLDFDLHRAHMNLVQHITTQDRKDEARALRAGRHFNTYALPIMFEAAQRAHDEAETEIMRSRYDVPGAVERAWVKAVMRNFNPTRSMHTYLRKIDPRIDVRRGNWVASGGTET